MSGAADLAAMTADELAAEHATARAHVENLRSRQESAVAAVSAAEEAVKTASVAMASSGEPEAAAEFEKATKRLAEAQAAAAAFEQHVIPAAVQRVADIQAALGQTRVREANERGRDIAKKLASQAARLEQQLAGADATWAEMRATMGAIRSTVFQLTGPQEYVLRNLADLARMAPPGLIELLSGASSRKPDHAWAESLLAAFGLEWADPE